MVIRTKDEYSPHLSKNKSIKTMPEAEAPSRSVSRSKSSGQLKMVPSSRKIKDAPERGVSRSKSSSAATSASSEDFVPERSISRSKSSRRSSDDGAPLERGVSRRESKRSESRMKERSSKSGSKRGDLKRSASSRRGGLERTSSERSTSKRGELRRSSSSRGKSSRDLKRTSSRGSFDEDDEMPSLMKSSSGRGSLERTTSKRGSLKRSTSSRRGELRRTSSERSKSKRGELKRSSSSRGKSSRNLKRAESWRSSEGKDRPSLKRASSSRSHATKGSTTSSKGSRGKKRGEKLRVNIGGTDVCIYHEPKSRKSKKKDSEDEDENMSSVPPSDLWYDRYEMIQFNKTYFGDARALVYGLSAEDKQVVLDITAHCKSADSMMYAQDEEGGKASTPDDPVDMNLREQLYQVFKKDKNHIGLSNLVAKEVYEDIKARRMKLVETVQEIQSRTFESPDKKASEIREACEIVTKSSMVFARYVAWASTKMKAVDPNKTKK